MKRKASEERPEKVRRKRLKILIGEEIMKRRDDKESEKLSVKKERTKN